VAIDVTRRVQSLYVPVREGVRIAVDVWLPVGRTGAGGRVSSVVRSTRYHRAEAPSGPELEADTNLDAGNLWNAAGFALVLVDARGTGASFGTRTAELGEREIADFGEVVDWVAGQPWSDGRVRVAVAGHDVGCFTSYGLPETTCTVWRPGIRRRHRTSCGAPRAFRSIRRSSRSSWQSVCHSSRR
jgi:predicted acyl esterase